MQSLRTITVLCVIGLVFSTPVQNDGVKSTGHSGVKSHDGTTRYVSVDNSGDFRLRSPGHVVRVDAGSAGWQSSGPDVVPSQIDAAQDKYAFEHLLKPQEWMSGRVQKKYATENVPEQRHEEPVAISGYRPVLTAPISSDSYREILPEVLQGKRRLGEEDVPVSGHSEISSFTSEGGKVSPAPGAALSPAKAPVKPYVYGDKSVPQHAYTEDTFPSLITLKGRQYLVVPHKTRNYVEPYFTSSVSYPFSWEAYSGYSPSVHQSSHVFQSIPVREVGKEYHHQFVQQGYDHGLLPFSQSLTGQSIHHLPNSFVYQPQQAPVQSSSYPQFVRPVVPKVSYQPSYWNSQPWTYSTKYSAQVPQYHTTQTQVVHSSPSPSNWKWISAPQYISKDQERPSSWVIKGIRKEQVTADAPVQYDVTVPSGVKTFIRSPDTELKHTWSSSGVQQATGKDWYVYTPMSAAPWSYGAVDQTYGPALPASAVIPQYSGEWSTADAAKTSSQWSGPAYGDNWSAKTGLSAVSSHGESTYETARAKPVQVAPAATPAVHGLHYAVEINHGPSRSTPVQQTLQVSSELPSSTDQYGTKSGSVQVHSVDHSS